MGSQTSRPPHSSHPCKAAISGVVPTLLQGPCQAVIQSFDRVQSCMGLGMDCLWHAHPGQHQCRGAWALACRGI